MNSEDAFVSPSEGVLKHETYARLMEEVRSWNDFSSLHRPGLAATTGAEEPNPRQFDAERELPPAQASAVLSVAQDLEGMEFGLNDYYDGAEPQGVIDDEGVGGTAIRLVSAGRR